jgi:hypothetical protein
MRKISLKRIYKKITGYFLLILFLGYFGSITFFSHTHIVDGVTIVHSHPYKSHSGNIPFNHNHSKNGFIFIQFISHFIVAAPIVLFGAAIIRKILNIWLLIHNENLNLNFYHYNSHLPRAPTS